MCVYSPGTFSVICAELLPQELTSVSPHVIIAQSDYEEREGEGERGRGKERGGVRDSIFRTDAPEIRCDLTDTHRQTDNTHCTWQAKG